MAATQPHFLAPQHGQVPAPGVPGAPNEGGDRRARQAIHDLELRRRATASWTLRWRRDPKQSRLAGFVSDLSLPAKNCSEPGPDRNRRWRRLANAASCSSSEFRAQTGTRRPSPPSRASMSEMYATSFEDWIRSRRSSFSRQARQPPRHAAARSAAARRAPSRRASLTNVRQPICRDGPRTTVAGLRNQLTTALTKCGRRWRRHFLASRTEASAWCRDPLHPELS